MFSKNSFYIIEKNVPNVARVITYLPRFSAAIHANIGQIINVTLPFLRHHLKLFFRADFWYFPFSRPNEHFKGAARQKY